MTRRLQLWFARKMIYWSGLDDSPWIQNRVCQLAAEGKIIHLPPGRYRLLNQIILPPNSEINIENTALVCYFNDRPFAAAEEPPQQMGWVKFKGGPLQ